MKIHKQLIAVKNPNTKEIQYAFACKCRCMKCNAEDTVVIPVIGPREKFCAKCKEMYTQTEFELLEQSQDMTPPQKRLLSAVFK